MKYFISGTDLIILINSLIDIEEKKNPIDKTMIWRYLFMITDIDWKKYYEIDFSYDKKYEQDVLFIDDIFKTSKKNKDLLEWRGYCIAKVLDV